MRLQGISTGDLVRVNRLGRMFIAEVTGTTGGGLTLLPIDRRVSYRTCRSREVVDHWARRGRPVPHDAPLEPSPRQLELELG